MALNPLTLDVTSGVAGRAFQATISGLSAGSTLEIVNASSTGYYTVNGRLYNDRLPARTPLAVHLRETLAGTGTRDSRIDIAVDGIALGAAGLPSALPSALAIAGINRAAVSTILAASERALTNNPYDNAVTAQAVTVTETTGAAGALTRRIRIGLQGGAAGGVAFETKPDLFRYAGGKPVLATQTPTGVSPIATGGFNIDVFQFLSCTSTTGGVSVGSVNGYSNSWTASFMFDGASIDLLLMGKGSNPYRIAINDQYINKTATNFGGNAIRFVNIAGLTGTNKITIDCQTNAGFAGINCLPTDSVWPVGRRPVIAIPGDSLTLGTAALYQAGAWNRILGDRMGCDIAQCAQGGTGYLATGSPAGVGLAMTAPARLDDVAATSPDLVIVSAGYNDYNNINGATVTAAQLSAACLTTYQGLRSRLPQVPIVVTGSWCGATGPSATMLATEDAIKAGFDQWADGNSRFIPVARATQPPIFGTGTIGATNSTGNSDKYVNADTVHWPDAGHAFIADWARRQLIGTLRGMVG